MSLSDALLSSLTSLNDEFIVRPPSTASQVIAECFYELCVDTLFDFFEMVISQVEAAREGDVVALLRRLDAIVTGVLVEGCRHEIDQMETEGQDTVEHYNLRREAAYYWISVLDCPSHRSFLFERFLGTCKLSPRIAKLVVERSTDAMGLLIRSCEKSSQLLLQWSIQSQLQSPVSSPMGARRTGELLASCTGVAQRYIPETHPCAFRLGKWFMWLLFLMATLQLCGIIDHTKRFFISSLPHLASSSPHLLGDQNLAVMCLREEFVESRYCDDVLFKDTHNFGLVPASTLDASWAHRLVLFLIAVFCDSIRRLFSSQPPKRTSEERPQVREAALRAARWRFFMKRQALASHASCMLLFDEYEASAHGDGDTPTQFLGSFASEEFFGKVSDALWSSTPNFGNAVQGGSLPCLASLLLFTVVSYRRRCFQLDLFLTLENDLSVKVIPFLEALLTQPINTPYHSLLIALIPHLHRLCNNLRYFTRTPPRSP